MKMSHELTVQSEDGWGDAAAESAARVIKGQLLKFADWQWTRGKEGLHVEDGTQLVAINTAAAWVRWCEKKPVEYRMREPGRRLPDREELGHTDESLWETGPDNAGRDPWQNTRFVYFIDPLTAEAFTFSTHTFGGRGAVSDLADQIGRVRQALPSAVPLVELGAAPMLTKFGKKSKPAFTVKEWRNGGGGSQETLPMIESKRVPEKAASEAFHDDEVPF
jgi:hypothetical protein